MRSNLRDLIDRLIRDIPNIRVGLMAHGDYLDHRVYVTKSHDLSADADSLKKFAMNVPSTSGGGNDGEVWYIITVMIVRVECLTLR